VRILIESMEMKGLIEQPTNQMFSSSSYTNLMRDESSTSNIIKHIR